MSRSVGRKCSPVGAGKAFVYAGFGGSESCFRTARFRFPPRTTAGPPDVVIENQSDMRVFGPLEAVFEGVEHRPHWTPRSGLAARHIDASGQESAVCKGFRGKTPYRGLYPAGLGGNLRSCGEFGPLRWPLAVRFGARGRRVGGSLQTERGWGLASGDGGPHRRRSLFPRFRLLILGQQRLESREVHAIEQLLEAWIGRQARPSVGLVPEPNQPVGSLFVPLL